MIKIKNLTVRNFLSVGNAMQALNFNRTELVLVLGENLDLGGHDSGSRNGVGKSTIIQSISYALYGEPISDIRKEHLINKSNGKNMVVTLDFEVRGVNYRISRGRKPNFLEFYVDGVRKDQGTTEVDSAQGDSRETQEEIEQILGLSHDMFCQIVAINTYTVPFLFQKIAEQRTVIEQLLGITLLSEKAEKLKESAKISKDALTQEEQHIRAIEAANKRIQTQIDNLINKQADWAVQHREEIAGLQEKILRLNEFDIDQELLLHTEWQQYNSAQAQLTSLTNNYNQSASQLDKEKTLLDTLQANLSSLEQQCCHTCSQPLQTEKHQELMEDNQHRLEKVCEEIIFLEQKLIEIAETMQTVPKLKKPRACKYSTVSEAHDHRNKLMLLQQKLEHKTTETDPYQQQIDSLKTAALETVDLTMVNELSRFVEHQEYLLKLLTNKDSFIRKKIIDQNLSYLNTRLSYYLNILGLPHEVTFQNDLSVSISELGRELSPGNLSRGEMTRLSLGLSFAFRDVWEGLYDKINILMIDESIDNGLDSSGIQNATKLLRDMNREQHRDVWLISHKDELISKFTTICKVIKENGFTSFEIIE